MLCLYNTLVFFASPCPELITKSPLTPPKLSIHGGLGRGERSLDSCGESAIYYIEQSLSPGSSLNAGAPLLSLSCTTPPTFSSRVFLFEKKEAHFFPYFSPVSLSFFFLPDFHSGSRLLFLFSRYRCHRCRGLKYERQKKIQITVTNWTLGVCICWPSPAQPSDQIDQPTSPAFSFTGLVRWRFSFFSLPDSRL